MKEDVAQGLKRGNAPPGYVVTDWEDGAAVVVEYPHDLDALIYTGRPPLQHAAGPLLSGRLGRCAEILERQGYSAAAVPVADHSRLVVRRH